MPRVYVSIGSNVDRERHVPESVQALRERFGEIRVSGVYESEPVGFSGEPFFNLVVSFDTDLEPRSLSRVLEQIELRAGRVRSDERFSPRTLDLDLILYGDAVLHGEGLEIPREEITRYAFVLRPLAEIAGALRHPVSGERIADLWAAFDPSTQPTRRVPLDLIPRGDQS